MQTSMSFVPGTFNVNGSVFRVTQNGEFIALCDMPDVHVGPKEQWTKAVQAAAISHLEANK